jgi:hypothetical protein
MSEGSDATRRDFTEWGCVEHPNGMHVAALVLNIVAARLIVALRLRRFSWPNVDQ